MPRCKYDGCKKKIPSVLKEINRCRCGKLYCSKHRLDHQCTFDYHAHYKETLKKELIKVVPEKVLKV